MLCLPPRVSGKTLQSDSPPKYGLRMRRTDWGDGFSNTKIFVMFGPNKDFKWIRFNNWEKNKQLSHSNYFLFQFLKEARSFFYFLFLLNLIKLKCGFAKTYIINFITWPKFLNEFYLKRRVFFTGKKIKHLHSFHLNWPIILALIRYTYNWF